MTVENIVGNHLTEIAKKSRKEESVENRPGWGHSGREIDFRDKHIIDAGQNARFKH